MPHQLVIRTENREAAELLSKSIEQFRAGASLSQRKADVSFGARIVTPLGTFEFTIAEIVQALKEAPPAAVEGLFAAIKQVLNEVRLLVNNKQITVDQLEKAYTYKDFTDRPFDM